jgi:hypothetical protein
LANNEGMEHLIHFKEFKLMIHPMVLILEGNFCENILRFVKESKMLVRLISPKKKKKTLEVVDVKLKKGEAL